MTEAIVFNRQNPAKEGQASLFWQEQKIKPEDRGGQKEDAEGKLEQYFYVAPGACLHHLKGEGDNQKQRIK